MIIIKDQFIKLGQVLKILDYASSGGEIKQIIKELDIKINNEKENRRGRKIYKNDILIINGKKIDLI